MREIFEQVKGDRQMVVDRMFTQYSSKCLECNQWMCIVCS
jgi:hypothetical protein